MVELNHRQRSIKVKVVYYGPAVGGKTTNLQVLHQNLVAERRGEMISIHSAQDRTIVFDLLPMKAAGFRGFDLRLQLATVPGQAMYAATRRLVLKGVDSVVFVANSAANRWDENVQSFREMADNLIAHQLDPASLPLVLQYNKRDLPEVTPIDFMERALNARGVPAMPAVATRGEGVLETFTAVLAATMEDLVVRYQVVDIGRGQPLQKWVRQAVLDMFGATTLTPAATADEMEQARSAVFYPPSSPELPAQDRRALRIEMPEEALRLAAFSPTSRANETLVETYADAAARLGNDLSEMREQKERLRSGLARVEAVLACAQDLIAGQPAEPTLRLALEALAEAAGSRCASVVVRETGGAFRSAAFRGLTEDLLLPRRVGERLVERYAADAEPRLHQAVDSLDLGEVLQEAPLPIASLASVPLRTHRGLRGLLLFYYSPDDVLPDTAALSHLKVLASALAPALELVSVADRLDEAERASELALAGLAAQRGVDELLSALSELRDRVGAVRRDPALTLSARETIGELAPGLAASLTVARSLRAFSRGEDTEHDLTDLSELVRGLGPSVEVAWPAEPISVMADPVLLRLALGTLIDSLRKGSSERVEVRLALEAGLVRLEVALARGGSARNEPSPSVALALELTRRIVGKQGGALSTHTEEGRPWAVIRLKPASS